MHSGAHSVRIVLERRPDGQLAVMVDDDGRGVDTHPERPVGLGTVGMRERALFLGGQLLIESEPGVGTTVHAIFPSTLLVPEDSTLHVQNS
jgi:signal transduction histidine kinase